MQRARLDKRALPFGLFMVGVLAAAMPAAAMQASATDTATKAAMDKRAAGRTLLSSALGRIAANGNNAAALLDAGRASMALDDYRSALGFLLRAEQNSPRDGAIKAALGTAMVHQENPSRALDYFGEAQLLKTPERLFIADRALAYDLLGQQEAAQRDYALALGQKRDDEVIRRYALSLGISGHADRAIEMLAPQLAAQDRGAWRTRAMILAMNGRQDEAKSIVDATMPKPMAENIWPYLAQMDRLTPSQLAEAAHFGRFPSGPLGPKRSPVQMAAASPPAPIANRNSQRRDARAGVAAVAARPVAAQPAAPQAATQSATKQRPVANRGQSSARPPAAPPVQSAARATSTPSRVEAVVAAQTAAPAQRTAPAAVSPSAGTNTSSAAVAVPSAIASTAPASSAGRPVAGPVNEGTSAVRQPPPPAAAAAATAKPLAAMASLGDIIGSLEIPAAELVRSDDAVSADTLSRLRAERRRAEQAAAAERAARARAEAEAKAKADAAAKAKAEAEAKAKAEEARKRANPARLWVQIGTGANPDALVFDWNRYKKKHPQIMNGQKGATAEWGRTRRLLVGPFANRTAAQKFLTEFKKAEGDGFIFNSSVGEEIESIS